jgi:hypothetical protein
MPEPVRVLTAAGALLRVISPAELLARGPVVPEATEPLLDVAASGSYRATADQQKNRINAARRGARKRRESLARLKRQRWSIDEHRRASAERRQGDA